MVASSTLKKYEGKIEILKGLKINYLKHPQKLIEWFDNEKYSVSTRKLYLSAIKYFHPDTFPEVFQNEIYELYQLQNERAEDQKLTPTQEDNYIEWKDILKLQEKLADEPNKTKRLWLEYLVVSLYTLNAPVRVDYGEMKVFTTDEERSGNELIMDEKPHFVFRNYKTAKTYGTIRVEVNPELLDVILEWFGYLEDVPEYLLGKKYADSTLGNIIRNTFINRLGRAVGASLLRHSYISYIYPTLNTLKEKKEIARRMLHSTDLQEKYRVINSND